MKSPKPLIAHNLSIASLMQVLKAYPCKYVDAFVVDELTLKFRASDWQGEEDQTNNDEEGEQQSSETDIDSLIT